MSYNSNIPANSDYMLISQPQIRANFQAIATTFAQNHESLNSSLQGYHDVLTFRQQNGDPVTTAGQVALYTKQVASTYPALFYAPQSSQTPIQMTYQTLVTGSNNATPPVYLTTQQSFIAGPFVIYMGYIAGATVGQGVIVSPVTTLLYVGLSVLNTGIGALVSSTACATGINTSPGTGTFLIQFSTVSTSQNIYYFAIGKP